MPCLAEYCRSIREEVSAAVTLQNFMKEITTVSKISGKASD